MSLVYKADKYVLINHSKYIDHLYRNVSENEENNTYELVRNLFSIQNRKAPSPSSRKRSHGSNKVLDETLEVQQMYEQFLIGLPTEFKSADVTGLFDTSAVRDLAKKLFETSIFDHSGISGGNQSDVAVKCQVKGENFLFPRNSRFYCGCVKEQCKKLKGSQFDILIADPPWWNKYIRRLKGANDKLSYSMMYNEDIATIPVKDLLSPNCLVAVWCTNAPSNIEAVKNIIFPQWGVTYAATWYWLKTTIDLKPLCPFSTGHMKQPYERIIIGTVGDIEVPKERLIVSVPSALHSHKPPIMDLLTQLLKKENPQILELFARYLLPNTTSVGFEPLKWQHISLYDKIT